MTFSEYIVVTYTIYKLLDDLSFDEGDLMKLSIKEY